MNPNSDQLTRAFFRSLAVALGLVTITPGPAIADNYAVTSGDWSSAATWSAGVPTDNNTVAPTEVSSIGEYSPGARTATVTLSHNSAANFLTLGDGSGNSGTLDLHGFKLTANYLYLGNGGAATILRTGGGTLSISAYGHLYVNYGSFVFAPGDTAAELDLSSYYGTTATTAATGNITNVAMVPAGTTLTLGGNLTLSSITNVPGLLSLSGTLNANGYAISAPTVGLTAPFTLTDRASITAGTLSVTSNNSSQINFNLIAADAVAIFNLYGVNSILPPGAAVPNLNLYSNANVVFPPATPAYSTVTTTAVGNITGSVLVQSGNTLTLGANLSLTGNLELGGTLNANGYAISADQVLLGYNNGGGTLSSHGPITANLLSVTTFYNQSTFNLIAGDTINTYSVYGITTNLPAGAAVQNLNVDNGGSSNFIHSTATTSAVGNITNQAEIDPGSTLNLGANLTLTTSLDLRGTLNANGHSLTTPAADLGYNGGPATLQNDGLVTVGTWNQGNGTQIQLHQPGDALGSILLSSSSKLTIADAAGQLTGLTVTDQTVGAISIDSTSGLILDVNGLASGWVFRWADPPGGDHIADLQALISGGEVEIFPVNGGFYSLTSDGAYTYVNLAPVPEPSAMLLSVAAAGMLVGIRRLRGRVAGS